MNAHRKLIRRSDKKKGTASFFKFPPLLGSRFDLPGKFLGHFIEKATTSG